MNDISIKVTHLTKVYKLYDKPIDRLKESLHPLKKQYHKEFYALNDVSFEIKKGDTVGVIGKNGAGKSTLLKIITGVLTPTNGNVKVNGRIASLLELGAGFNPEYTGVENIYLQGTLMGYGHKEMQAKIDEILTFADIGNFVYQPVKSYSSGMFARLAFSIAINVEPDILIVDEALSVGDFAFQYKCFQKFKKLQLTNKTILFVTHGMQEVQRYCNRAIFIHDGKKLEDSYNTEEVVFNYETLIRGKDKKYNIEVSSSGEEHRFGTHEAKIQSIVFSQENKNNLLFSGEKTKITLLIDVYKNLEKLVLGYSLKNVKGVSTWGDCSFSQGKDFFDLKEGSYTFTIQFDANLVEGDYYFYIGLSSFQENKIDIDQRWRSIKVSFISNIKMCEGVVYAPSIIKIEENISE